MPHGPSQWPRAVLFDFDGVIVNSEPLHFYAFHEVLKAANVEITEDEYYRELIGFDDRGGFRHVFQKRGLPLEPKTLLALMDTLGTCGGAGTNSLSIDFSTVARCHAAVAGNHSGTVSSIYSKYLGRYGGGR